MGLPQKMNVPEHRHRRLRAHPGLRAMVGETTLDAAHLIQPLFVHSGRKEPIPSMPGMFRHSPDSLVEEVQELQNVGVSGILLFGIPRLKDANGSEASAADGVVQQAVRALKGAGAKLAVITDVCLCGYTDHGHCGLVVGGTVDNDATLPALARVAVSHALAGADMVAPSDMMDGRVGVIRRALDEAGFVTTPIMSYAAKYASAFYGPFRDAAGSAPRSGDRRGYQMDPANAAEALREAEADIREGADVVMVKPALAYLDVIRRVKERFNHPVAAYSTSGEYAMVKAASKAGWLDERAAVVEIVTGIRRAGADVVITYWARDVAKWLGERLVE